jgi:hypothetical protein
MGHDRAVVRLGINTDREVHELPACRISGR